MRTYVSDRVAGIVAVPEGMWAIEPRCEAPGPRGERCSFTVTYLLLDEHDILRLFCTRHGKPGARVFGVAPVARDYRTLPTDLLHLAWEALAEREPGLRSPAKIAYFRRELDAITAQLDARSEGREAAS